MIGNDFTIYVFRGIRMKAEIREYILNQIAEHASDITATASKRFRVTRQTVVNYLNQLAAEGLITAIGKTRARKYELKELVEKNFAKRLVSNMAEDILWRQDILPLMDNTPSNVAGICQYGFTEIVRNVFDHSQSKAFLYSIQRNAVRIELSVFDHGVGIFNKIQRDFNLNDPRHALLELAKGKLTSDPTGHSGEGIFFASRMFDKFSIFSRPLFYIRQSKEDSDWLLETGESDRRGTLVQMEISPYSSRTMQGVYDAYSPGKDTYGFTRTHVPIEIARYEGEQLVSRSQARRLLARVERFEEALLDFNGVTTIGQAFADEIFRVYQLEHPEITILCINVEEDVEKMIRRAKADVPAEQRQLF